MIMRKAMITNPRSRLDGRLLNFLQLFWFILLVMHLQVDVDSLNKGFLLNLFSMHQNFQSKVLFKR
jgi:hypothetical protein